MKTNQLFMLVTLLSFLACPLFVSAQSLVVHPPLITSVVNSPRSPPPGSRVNVTASVNSYPRSTVGVFLAYFSSRDRVNRTVPMSLLSGNATMGNFLGFIPEDVTLNGVTVTYHVEAIDSSGFEGASDPETFLVQPDRTPPVFQRENPPRSYLDVPILNTTQVEISFEVTDEGSGVRAVLVRYSNSTDPTHNLSQNVSLGLTEGDRFDGLWSGTIHPMPDGVVFYQAEASDFSGNHVVSSMIWQYTINPLSAFMPSATVQIGIFNVDLQSRTFTTYFSISTYSPSRYTPVNIGADVETREPSFNSTHLTIPYVNGFEYQASFTTKLPIYDVNLWPFDSYTLDLTIRLAAPGLNKNNTHVELFVDGLAQLQFDAFIIRNETQTTNFPDEIQILVQMQLNRKAGLVDPVMQAIYAVFLVLGSVAFIRPTEISRRLELFLGLFTFTVILYFTLVPILQSEGITKLIGIVVPQALLIGLAWSIALFTSLSLLIAYFVGTGWFAEIITAHRCLLRHAFNFLLAGVGLAVTWYYGKVFVGFSGFGGSEYSYFLSVIPTISTYVIGGLFGPPIVAAALDRHTHSQTRRRKAR